MWVALIKRIGQKLGISKDTMSVVFYSLGIVLVFTILSLVSFTETEITFGARTDINFWARYGLIMVGAFIVLVLTIASKKTKLRMDERIADKEEIIRTYANTIQMNGYYLQFLDFIIRRNVERKIEAYREELSRKRDKAKSDEEKRAINEKYLATFKDDFDVNMVTANVRQYSWNAIFFGSTGKKKEADIFYSGHEGLFASIFPALAFSVAICILVMGTSFNAKATTLNQIKDFLTAVSMLVAYIIKGLNYAETSINVIYYSALERRIREVKMFFQRQGLNINHYDNDTYKYSAEINKLEESDKKVETPQIVEPVQEANNG